MNFDLVGAKEEEHLHTQSVPSTGELSDTELESIYAAGFFPIGGAAAASSLASDTRVHSFSVTCDINIFSLNLLVIPVINIANCINQICANSN